MKAEEIEEMTIVPFRDMKYAFSTVGSLGKSAADELHGGGSSEAWALKANKLLGECAKLVATYGHPVADWEKKNHSGGFLGVSLAEKKPRGISTTSLNAPA